ncbi:protein kinase domain-containing protein [Candidatus Uabimicrobium amorphum]|uniref:protein kinase domain-containing protein n=1 Tax=Uabimicrobium amorphum TaxID=2596890 RepID=UPI0015653962|nr:protein kinase [Candidatus Uabimicrobium amorphum]
MDEWLIQQIISCNLLSAEQLAAIKEIKNTTGDTYEKILVDKAFMLPQQLQQMKSQYQKAITQRREATATSKTMASSVSSPEATKYRTIKKLGEGNFGEVFLIYDNYWKRNLALKVLKSNLNDEVSIKRFQREARSIAKLHYPGVVKVYDMGEQNGKYYYTMDYIDGLPLDEYIKKEGRISSKRAARIIRDVAKVVEHAHSQDVIHRDIKPENIMIGNDGKTYVTDFGLAKGLYNDSKISEAGNILGTPSYMSPEQAQGKKNQLDKRTDIYGIGATLYELITGRPPFVGKNTPVVLYNIVHKYPRSPRSIHSSIPEVVERICLKCLEKDKNKRYQSMSDFIKDIQTFLEAKTMRIAKAAVTKKKKYNSNVIAAICGVIVVVTSAIIYTVGSTPQTKRVTSKTRTAKKTKQTVQNTKQTAKATANNKKNVAKKTLRETMWEDYANVDQNIALQMVILKSIMRRFPEDYDKIQKALQQVEYDAFVRTKLVDGTFFEGTYYGAFHVKMSWLQANETCKKMQGQLAVIDNEKSQEFLKSFIQHSQKNICQCFARCWIGLRRENNVWRWVNNKPLEYANWMEGEPNNRKGFEYYVEVINGEKWNDNIDQQPFNFICAWSVKK